MQWIKTTDELPQDNKAVLAVYVWDDPDTGMYEFYAVLKYWDKRWYNTTDNDHAGRPTYWTPITPAPRLSFDDPDTLRNEL